MSKQRILKTWVLSEERSPRFPCTLRREFFIAIGRWLGFGWYNWRYDGLPTRGLELGVIAFRFCEYTEWDEAAAEEAQ